MINPEIPKPEFPQSFVKNQGSQIERNGVSEHLLGNDVLTPLIQLENVALDVKYSAFWNDVEAVLENTATPGQIDDVRIIMKITGQREADAVKYLTDFVSDQLLQQ
jgi:hypothetical protein